MNRPWFPRHSPDEFRDRGAGPSQPGYAQQLGVPRSGHGTVYVSQNRDGTWSGSWQDDYPAPDADGAAAGVEDIDGVTEDQVIEWAVTRPAERAYVVLPTDESADGVRQSEAVPLDAWLHRRREGS
jgi:hypothetical protein